MDAEAARFLDILLGKRSIGAKDQNLFPAHLDEAGSDCANDDALAKRDGRVNDGWLDACARPIQAVVDAFLLI